MKYFTKLSAKSNKLIKAIAKANKGMKLPNSVGYDGYRGYAIPKEFEKYKALERAKKGLHKASYPVKHGPGMVVPKAGNGFTGKNYLQYLREKGGVENGKIIFRDQQTDMMYFKKHNKNIL